MVVVKGSASGDALLTTLAGTTSRKSAVVEGYLTRWRVEDAIRFVKQSYNPRTSGSDVPRLKNMVALLLASSTSTRLAGRRLRSSLTTNITRQAHLRRGRVPPLRRRRRPRGSSRATGNGTATSRQTPNQTRSDWSFWNDQIFDSLNSDAPPGRSRYTGRTMISTAGGR